MLILIFYRPHDIPIPVLPVISGVYSFFTVKRLDYIEKMEYTPFISDISGVDPCF